MGSIVESYCVETPLAQVIHADWGKKAEKQQSMCHRMENAMEWAERRGADSGAVILK